jgi:nucleotide-binding universal stress UspA family protein
MKAIETILCPTDFSPCARATRDIALDLASRTGAQLWLVHVVEPPIVVGMDPGLAMISSQLIDIELRTGEQLTEVEAAAYREVGGGVAVRGEVYLGIATPTILSLSSRAQLIVMGTHGRGALAHFFFGSVAERVVRHAKCPVMTVGCAQSSAGKKAS